MWKHRRTHKDNTLPKPDRFSLFSPFICIFNTYVYVINSKRPFDTAVIIFIRTQCTHLPVLRSADTDSQQPESSLHQSHAPEFLYSFSPSDTPDRKNFPDEDALPCL